MNFRGNRRREELSLNITPLIDVVFLLLIFFMLTTTFAKEKEISINLPRSVDAVISPEQYILELSIDAQGEFYLNNRHLVNRQRQTLIQALSKALVSANKPAADISLRLIADGKTPHQSVVTALDAVGKLGFTKVQIATISE